MDDLYQERRASASQSTPHLVSPFLVYVNTRTVGATPTPVYARQVVQQVLKPRPGKWVWLGQNSSLVWFMRTFLPSTAFVSIAIHYLYRRISKRKLQDSLMRKRFGLDIFARRIARRSA